jgi:hypothetical protein
MRPVTRLGWTLGVGLLAVGLVATPASGDVHAKPKPGRYSGQAHYSSGPVAVTFSVNRKRTKVVNFSSDALVKPGCTAPNSSFETPLTPEKISRSGGFKQSYGAYIDSSGKPYHVTVTVKGHFTSRTKAVGTFILVSKKYKHCNQNASWSATRAG